MFSNFNVVEMTGISKSFFGVRVLDGVEFSVAPGEIHALAGENGAGKSTLMKILQGVYTMDSGHIEIAGQPVQIHSFHDAQSHGIGMVFQEFSLIPDLSVAQNIFLNREPKNVLKLIADHNSVSKAKKVLESVGIDIDVTAKVSSLRRAYQQLTEIAKAIAADAKILILDEATSALDSESEIQVQRALKGLMENRTSVVIAHRLSTIRQANVIALLKDGLIIEQGNHESLMKMENGKYRRMVEQQIDPSDFFQNA